VVGRAVVGRTVVGPSAVEFARAVLGLGSRRLFFGLGAPCFGSIPGDALFRLLTFAPLAIAVEIDYISHDHALFRSSATAL
jgi:hypothetical protein